MESVTFRAPSYFSEDPERNPYPGDIKKTIQPSEIVDLISYILAQPDHSIFKRIVVFPSNEWH